MQLNRLDLQNSSDEELARDARAGSVRSFEELVRRYQVPLLRFLQRKTPNASEAEDILQDSFLKAYQSLHRYRDGYAFKTWIFTISYRVAVSSARGLKLTTEASGDFPSPPQPTDRLEQEETRGQLWNLARRVLSPDQFSTLWLYYVEEMPARDIGKVMGRSWVWVKTAMHRARTKLQTAMQGSSLEAEYVRGES